MDRWEGGAPRMIHFDQPPEPLEFDDRCRQRGTQWLEHHPGADRPRDYWSEFKSQLADGFFDLCAYTVMYVPNGTVDHYLSFKNHHHLAYEWSNYRFCAGWMNSSKADADDTVLDPFQLQNGWFEIILPSLQLRVTDQVPAQFRQKAEYTLKRLHLQDDERVIRQRYEWYRMYQEEGLTLDGLSRKAPLLRQPLKNNRMGKHKLNHGQAI
jgi:hypothetical protein